MTDELTGRPERPGPPRSSPQARAELDPDRAALHDLIADGPRRAQSRVPLVDDEGRLLGPFGAMLHSPRIGAAVQQVGAALRTDPDLPPRLRELAVLAVAAHVRSEFEWSSHEGAARDAGLTGDQLQALLDGTEPAGLDPAEQHALRITRALLVDRDVDDDLYTGALAALGRDTLAALVWLVGYYAMLAGALATFRPAGPGSG
ncbi:carboxymuconolactone decarboxylase family protein [Pseudonocardia sp. RS11V-5]|uniref:carboxymuconolactone decarboxylase family protein n=1 Tax=Pseudonocardia terrae TaxID=2905831 RepID=UPI001E5103C3|nr:carboxymuconolactone decarboxylase family protein [Pseudonocardia terrae]MCE3550673.1 carboxymuconolactone decarboxylase family protein [Pseudonocardia terrae]